ncbi:YopX family protein [Lysinibacillus fusiformis]|uniref:YopX family protein n=1 Tax=Lysinibacillus fusiformis TaxID=28031 RepID=UPI00088959FB|nr:YopX family protein [Lysinibacillus fusiformis]SCX38400.1 phage uncharacterized protein TIGR01671 [Lysinibacillus fusiformis]SDB05420.1 phage uncharacterized protein TIGR01671 [Lysinibacillus fusiformis]SFH75221.1 phage uncharacterized protein TIGR01671 [Lysinibacillus fusiformis]SFT29748.1 phage uncharacterized protein TIGR01671 [Lysinibacillus fusiformis]
MREIKFRAWDKDFKRFSENALNHTIADINFHTDYEWMQYTGLKDKNGKEIYEGDIVLLKNEFATWKGTVIFDEGAFKLSINHSYGNSKNHFSKTDEFNDMGAKIQLNNIYVVVGNIYENPELLGDSQ